MYLYTRQTDAHVRRHVSVQAATAVPACVRRVPSGMEGCRYLYSIDVGAYTRSSLPGELEFLAADRILLRESRDAHDTRDVGVRLQRACVHTRAHVGQPGLNECDDTSEY